MTPQVTSRGEGDGHCDDQRGSHAPQEEIQYPDRPAEPPNIPALRRPRSELRISSPWFSQMTTLIPPSSGSRPISSILTINLFTVSTVFAVASFDHVEPDRESHG